MNFKLIPVDERPEYVKVGYEGHDHLPVVFRIMKDNKSINTGVSFFKYGFVYINRIFYHYVISDKCYFEFIKRVFDTYIHEFLHCYFFTRLEKKDMLGYDKLRSKSWGWNENIVRNLTQIIGDIYFEDDENFFMWLNAFFDCRSWFDRL